MSNTDSVKKTYPLDVAEQLMCDQISAGVISMTTAVFELDHPVRPDALQFAAEQILKRHPYLATRLRCDGINFYLEENDLPVIIREASIDTPLQFGDETNNYYQWMLTYSGNCIYVDKSHFIMDGSAAHFWTAELFEHYIRFINGDRSELPPPSAETLADECALPTDIAYDPDAKPFYTPADVRPTPFKPGVFKDKPCTECVVVSIPLDDIKAHARRAEVSPFATIAPILFKASLPLLEEEADGDKTVCAMMPVSGRAMFGTNTFHNFAGTKVLCYYHNRMKDMPYEQAATICRSRLDLLTQKEDIAVAYTQRRNLRPMLDDPQKRQAIAGVMNKSIYNPNQITYTHMSKSKLSDTARAHLRRCYLVTTNDLPNIICVAITENGSVNLTFPDNFATGEFFDSLYACLREIGISFTSERIYYPLQRKVNFVG